MRSAHATTSLLEVDGRRILVNPSLPPQVLEVRLDERASLRLSDITDVFMTSFYPDHRRALPALDAADWWISEAEREAMEAFLESEQSGADSHDDHERQGLIRSERELVERTKIAPDHFADGVDLFPLPGISPGACGLLLPLPQQTVLVCGDAVATSEHLEQGQVLASSWNREQALESFKEAIEIADVLVLGRDNAIPNPIRSGGLLG